MMLRQACILISMTQATTESLDTAQQGTRDSIIDQPVSSFRVPYSITLYTNFIILHAKIKHLNYSFHLCIF